MEHTHRQKIRQLLMEGPHSLRDLSTTLRLSEKEILRALPHVEKSLRSLNQRIHHIPAECPSCGYEFTDRRRFTKPGKCPLCHHTAMKPPSFHIASARSGS
ncbi:transcriptional regulator [Desulfobotulus sp. H1]|uniref:Transcriptional regulator n=1 Tax=Desulfobotulus pelophilus TaxID=2823377 RepID=A0ABT3N828_9BACT|nr:transcriptional regulator [Desulfobotulus pelophilus]MCW7753604.1 transcriptional regulator [Desulfobotulus pelophilus]